MHRECYKHVKLPVAHLRLSSESQSENIIEGGIEIESSVKQTT